MLKKIKYLLFAGLLSICACNGHSPKENNDDNKYLTVSQAYDMALEAGENGTEERQYVTGVITNITNPTYGQMNISDGQKEMQIYGLYSSDGSLKYSEMEEKPYTGDTVYVYGFLKTYNGTPELGQSWLIKFKSNQEEFDIKNYEEMNINTAREKEEGSKVLISGVVACFTYANGRVPNGIFLVDNTNSIYVYGVDLASRVEVGNEVKIAGTKTYYILDGEKQNAATFGYKGSCQIQEPHLIDNKESNKQFDKTWIQKSTVKDILETPVSENITTSIFEVDAFINEVPGSGFTNFYINDLDNKTGSYCYSLNNGNDFTYLRPYNGKVNKVYLSPLNCKSTSSDCFFRFIPVLVEEEEYQFNPTYAPEYALKYYVKDQFLAQYNSDPSLEVITSVSNEYFGLENITITYESSNEDLIKFVNENDKLVMHLYEGQGTVKLTLKANYLTYSSQMEINVKVAYVTPPEDAINVKAAIDTSDGEEVIVHGIVAASLVNQTGFYLIDETGSIAVRTKSEELKQISLGDEVYMKGTRSHVKKDGSTNVGQSCIDDATLVVDLYGNNKYSTDSFIKNMTFEDIQLLTNSSEDLSTNVYETKCYLKKVEAQYYTNYYLTDVTQKKDILLYAASGSQYSAFNDFVDAGEITVQFAFCDWNSKSAYRGSLLSASNSEKIVINNYNFR